MYKVDVIACRTFSGFLKVLRGPNIEVAKRRYKWNTIALFLQNSRKKPQVIKRAMKETRNWCPGFVKWTIGFPITVKAKKVPNVIRFL